MESCSQVKYNAKRVWVNQVWTMVVPQESSMLSGKLRILPDSRTILVKRGKGEKDKEEKEEEKEKRDSKPNRRSKNFRDHQDPKSKCVVVQVYYTLDEIY